MGCKFSCVRSSQLRGNIADGGHSGSMELLQRKLQRKLDMAHAVLETVFLSLLSGFVLLFLTVSFWMISFRDVPAGVLDRLLYQQQRIHSVSSKFSVCVFEFFLMCFNCLLQCQQIRISSTYFRLEVLLPDLLSRPLRNLKTRTSATWSGDQDLGRQVSRPRS